MIFAISLVPYAIFAYMLFKLKGTPLLLVAATLTFSLGEAGFINGFQYRILIPYLIQATFRDISMLLLAIAAFYAKHKWPKLLILPKSALYKLFIANVAFILLYIPQASILDMEINISTFLNPRYFLYIPISVLLWLSIFKRCNIYHINLMFSLLFKITILGAILYSLSAVGFPIFPYTGWSSGLGFGTITRDFLTFPPYLSIALGYAIFNPNKFSNWKKLLVIFIFFITVLLSYTRSWILAFLLSIFITLLLSKNSKVNSLTLLILLPIVLFSSFLFIEHFAPNSSEFLIGRFSEFSNTPMPSNAENRLDGFSTIRETLQANGSLLWGKGFSHSSSNALSQMSLKGIVLGDSFWNFTFFYVGYLGLSLIILCFLLAIFYSFSILSSKRSLHIPDSLKLASISVFWILIRTSASTLFYWYPVITGLVFATLIYAYAYPTYSLSHGYKQ